MEVKQKQGPRRGHRLTDISLVVHVTQYLDFILIEGQKLDKGGT